ncbi:MAG: nitroreductase [Planctomycetaceae bacterium]|nr:nitroreductase [Planctomycetaceae bacterium]
MLDFPPNSTISDVIRHRRTIENFQPECPPRDVILRAIELARWAPNHKHTEPWRFHLLGDQTVREIARLNTELVREAKGDTAAAAKQQRWSSVPGWLVLTCEVTDDPIRSEEDYAACCCAAQNLALALWAEGIGMKWSTGAVTRTDEFARLLGLEPGERRIVGLFWYGYPASIPEARRKEVEDIINERP